MQSVRLAFLDEQRTIHGEDANVSRVHLAALPHHHGAAVGVGRFHAVAVDMEQDAVYRERSTADSLLQSRLLQHRQQPHPRHMAGIADESGEHAPAQGHPSLPVHRPS